MECPHCGCDAVIKDKIGSHEQSICTECGLVVSDQTFEEGSYECFYDAPPTGSIPAGVSASVRAVKREADKGPSYSPIGLQEIDIICDVLRLSSTQQQESEHLYQKACDESVLNVRYRSRLFKEVLGACCVYITLRKHEYPITAREMVALRKLPINDFIIMLRRLKQFMKVDFPVWSIGQLTKHTLGKAQFSLEMMERTHKLMQICDKCWLVSGRDPEAIIRTAAYFSWLSFQEPGVDLSMKTFCKQNNLSKSCTDGTLKVMKNVLIELAKCIPWVQNFKTNRFRYYIADIVKYKTSLMKTAFSRATPSGDRENREMSIGIGPPLLKKKCVEPEISDSKTADEIDAEITAQYGDALHSSELDPSEFEDEIDQYIKTDQEKQDAEVIRKIDVPENHHVLRTLDIVSIRSAKELNSPSNVTKLKKNE